MKSVLCPYILLRAFYPRHSSSQACCIGTYSLVKVMTPLERMRQASTLDAHLALGIENLILDLAPAI